MAAARVRMLCWDVLGAQCRLGWMLGGFLGSEILG